MYKWVRKKYFFGFTPQIDQYAWSIIYVHIPELNFKIRKEDNIIVFNITTQYAVPFLGTCNWGTYSEKKPQNETCVKLHLWNQWINLMSKKAMRKVSMHFQAGTVRSTKYSTGYLCSVKRVVTKVTCRWSNCTAAAAVSLGTVTIHPPSLSFPVSSPNLLGRLSGSQNKILHGTNWFSCEGKWTIISYFLISFIKL